MKTYILISFSSLALAVILGAFGAHAWKDILTGHESTFKLANDYQIWLSLAILIVVMLKKHGLSRTSLGPWLLIGGMCLFSGSLYLLSFPSIFGDGWRSILGPLTPLGGLLVIAAWGVLIVDVIKIKNLT